jgi:hypothetical protein
VIAFLQEENRVLKARWKGGALRFGDSERRRLAELGHRLDRRLPVDVATIVTPHTILRWHADSSRASGRTVQLLSGGQKGRGALTSR